MKKLFVNNIGDLAEIQRASFYRFLRCGIQEELTTLVNPFLARVFVPTPEFGVSKKKRCLVYLFPQEIKIKGPELSFEECAKQDSSYTFQVFIDVEFTYSNASTPFSKSISIDFGDKEKIETKERPKIYEIPQNEETAKRKIKKKKNPPAFYPKEKKKGIPFTFPGFLSKKDRSVLLIKQKMILAEIPLMTEEGTFYVNGVERIVVSQVIRSPGVYFQKQFGIEGNRIVYTATIISNKGLWTKFYLDFKSIKDKVRFKDFKEKVRLKQKEDSQRIKLLEKCFPDEKREDIISANVLSDPILEEDKPNAIFIRLSDFKQTSNEEKKQEAIRKDERLYIDDLLLYFGISFEDLEDSLIDPKYATSIMGYDEENRVIRTFEEWIDRGSTQTIDMSQNKVQAKKYLQRKEIEKKQAIPLVEKFLLSHHLNCFSIGEIGRYRFNKRLGLRLPKQFTYLTSYDFLGIINGLLELKYFGATNDDVDHIQNKMIRSVGELLQLQIRAGISQLRKNLIKTGNNNDSIGYAELAGVHEFEDLQVASNRQEWIIDPRAITKNLKDFFKSSQLAQYMDQINPLAEVVHKRRISVFGPNGLKRDQISTVIRDIHPSQYARICPIETPEGQNAGLISTLALYGRVNEMGCIETPYFLMNEKKIFVEKRPIFLNANQESEVTIAFCDSSFDSFDPIPNEFLSTKENYSFSIKKAETVPFITPSPIQMISLATALIPFVEHDDANRALMGSNMQRQSVPLLFTQKPIVGTGLESVTVVDSGMVVKTYHEGVVEYSSCTRIDIFDGIKQTIGYSLRKHYRSNQDTYFHQRPIVWVGEKVFSNQVIADGPGTNDGELALGRNLTIAYMPWEGYNYEDAIVLNERLILDECLTSVHIEEYDMNLNNRILLEERIVRCLPYLTKYSRRNLSKSGVIRLGSYVKENDILVGKITPGEQIITPEILLYEALFGKKGKKKKKVHYKDTSCRVPKGMEGRIVAIRFLKSPYLETTETDEKFLEEFYGTIRISIAQIRKIQIGDKLAGRHGNKGIVSRILASQDMPYLPDGTSVDIVFNPLGVPSRMNVGQIFECLLGLAGEKLGNRYKIIPFDEIYGREASRILVNQKLREASLKTNLDWIFHPIHPGKVFLRDGRTGEYFDNPITVGKSYILKLIHLVEDKIHTRSTGPYAMITEQPLAGKSQNGGQRFGEMEVWALEAYGCANILQELLTIKSDDIDGRRDMHEALISRTETRKPLPSISESFLALIRELNALGLDFSTTKVEKNLEKTNQIKKIEKDLFKEIEQRLHLRILFERKQMERYKKMDPLCEEFIYQKQKAYYKEQILKQFQKIREEQRTRK